MIGVLVNSYGISHAEGFLHYFEGWVIFGACIGLLFVLAILMQRLQRTPAPISETLDIDFDGVGPQLARIKTIVLTRPLVIATLITTVVSIGWLAVPGREPVRVDREPFGFFPIELGAWASYTTPLETSVEVVLAASPGALKVAWT